ncbi:MAG: hypothetical protein WBQ17_08660 [Rhizomicrobium sp.]
MSIAAAVIGTTACGSRSDPGAAQNRTGGTSFRPFFSCVLFDFCDFVSVMMQIVVPPHMRVMGMRPAIGIPFARTPGMPVMMGIPIAIGITIRDAAEVYRDSDACVCWRRESDGGKTDRGENQCDLKYTRHIRLPY